MASSGSAATGASTVAEAAAAEAGAQAAVAAAFTPPTSAPSGAAAATAAGGAAEAGTKSAASSLEVSLRTLVVNQHRKDALHETPPPQSAASGAPLSTPPPPLPSTVPPGSEAAMDPEAGSKADSRTGAPAVLALAEPALCRPVTLPLPVALRLPGLTSTPHLSTTAQDGTPPRGGSSSAAGSSAGGGSSSVAWPVVGHPAPSALAGAAVAKEASATAAPTAASASQPGPPTSTARSQSVAGSAVHVPSPFATMAAPPAFSPHSWQPLRAQKSLPSQLTELTELMGPQQPSPHGAQNRWQVRTAQSCGSSGMRAGGVRGAAIAPVDGAAGPRGTISRPRGFARSSGGVRSHGSSSGGSSRGSSRKALLGSVPAEGAAVAGVVGEARASIARAMAATAIFTSSRRILSVPEGCQFEAAAADSSIRHGSNSATAPLPVFGRRSLAAFQRRSSSGVDSVGSAGGGSSSCAQLLPPQWSSSIAGRSSWAGAAGSSTATATAQASQGTSRSNAGCHGDRSVPMRRQQLSLSSLLAAAGFGKAASQAKQQPLRGLSGCSSAEATSAGYVGNRPRAANPSEPLASAPPLQPKPSTATALRRTTSGPLLLRDAVAALHGSPQPPVPGGLPPKAASAGPAAPAAGRSGVPYRDAGLEVALAVARGCEAWLPDHVRRPPAGPALHAGSGECAVSVSASGAASAVVQESSAQPAPALTASTALAVPRPAAATPAVAPEAAGATIALPVQPLQAWGGATSISIRSTSLLHNSSTASGLSPTAAGASGTTISWPRFLAPTPTGPARATPPFAASAATAFTPPASATPRSCSPRSAFCLPGDLRGFHSDVLPLHPDSNPASASQPHRQQSELGLPATVLTPSGAPAFCIRLQQRGPRGSSRMGEMLLPISAPVELGADMFGEVDTAAGTVCVPEDARNAALLLDSMLFGMSGRDEKAATADGRSPRGLGGPHRSAGVGGQPTHGMVREQQQLRPGGAVGAAVAVRAKGLNLTSAPGEQREAVALSDSAGGGSNTTAAEDTASATVTAATALAAARQSIDVAAAPGGEVDTDPCLFITLMLMSRGGPGSNADASDTAVGDSASALGGVLGTVNGGGGGTAATVGPASHLLSSAAASSFDFTAAAAVAVAAAAAAAAAARPPARTGASKWRPAAGLAAPSEVDEHQPRDFALSSGMAPPTQNLQTAPSTPAFLKSASARTEARLGERDENASGKAVIQPAIVLPMGTQLGMASRRAASGPGTYPVLLSAHAPSRAAGGGAAAGGAATLQAADGQQARQPGSGQEPAAASAQLGVPSAQQVLAQGHRQMSVRPSLPEAERCVEPPPLPLSPRSECGEILRAGGATAADPPPKKGRMWSLFSALRRHTQRK